MNAPTPKPKAAAEKDQAQERGRDAEEPKRYAVDYLVTNAYSLLRSDRAEVEGALSGHGRKTFSLDEATAMITEHRGAEIVLEGHPVEESS